MSTTPSPQNLTTGIPVNFPQPPCREISSSSSLCEDCINVDDLNNKISAAESRLLEMKEARQKALSDANRRHDVLMKNFPLEICSTIFRQYLPPIDHIGLECSSGPLVLSAVSRSWRALCHSLPDLWAVMSLRATIRNDHRAEILSEVAQDWINRSRNQPLSLIIDISLYADPQGAYFPALIAAINRQSQRLAYLWMRAPGSLFDLVDFEVHGAQKLQILNVHSLDATMRRSRFGSCEPVHLSLINSNAWNLSTRFGIMTNNLSDAHLSGIHWKDLMEIFRNSKGLRMCSIDHNLLGTAPWEPWHDVPNQVKPPAIVHHALESLHLIKQHSAFIFIILMELLTLPSLTDFRFVSEGGVSGVTSRDLSNRLQQHINRSSAKLEVLALCNFNLDNFTEQALHTPIPSLMHTIGSTIRRVIIEPSLRTMFQGPRDLIESIINCGAVLPSLESIQVYGPPNWWMHTLRELTIAGEAFYKKTGKIICLILNVRNCSGWWANTLNELIGLQRTYPEDHIEDAPLALVHDDLPPLSIKDTDRLISSMVDTSRFVVQVLTTEKGVWIDICPLVIDILLRYHKQRNSQPA